MDRTTNENIIVLYFTLTGNTESIALIIASELSCEAERIRPRADSLHTIENYGRIVIGAPIWNLDIPSPFKEFLIKHNWRGVRIWPFYTSGGIYRYAPLTLQHICRGARIEHELIIVFKDRLLISNYLPFSVQTWCNNIRVKEFLIK